MMSYEDDQREWEFKKAKERSQAEAVRLAKKQGEQAAYVKGLSPSERAAYLRKVVKDAENNWEKVELRKMSAEHGRQTAQHHAKQQKKRLKEGGGSGLSKPNTGKKQGFWKWFIG